LSAKSIGIVTKLEAQLAARAETEKLKVAKVMLGILRDMETRIIFAERPGVKRIKEGIVNGGKSSVELHNKVSSFAAAASLFVICLLFDIFLFLFLGSTKLHLSLHLCTLRVLQRIIKVLSFISFQVNDTLILVGWG